MRIASIRLVNFRNFRDANVILASPTLIIGANEVGKTNMTYALRLLLDRTLSESDLEPRESDFYVHSDGDELTITIHFVDVREDCVVSRFRHHLSDDGELLLRYLGRRDPITHRKSYKLFAGRDEVSLEEIQSRYYLGVLNLHFIGSRRDLLAYITHERHRLLEDARAQRSDDQVDSDAARIADLDGVLAEIVESVSSLSYVAQATTSLNEQLTSLSHRHEATDVTFDVGAAKAADFVDGLRLVSRAGGKTLTLGGDGRNNQVHLALWAARNNLGSRDDEPLEVSLFCIEEPEAHLHPHQQRRLATYLSEALPFQVIITSHSPHVASALAPESIVRLCERDGATVAASDGATPLVERDLLAFGYRLNVLRAEAFFATAVLLVEGSSEVIFYQALAGAINLDIDRWNISVISVEGVGFAPYASLLRTLEIPYVIRTDNDVHKVGGKNEYRCVGILRALRLCQDYVDGWDEERIDADTRGALIGLSDPEDPQAREAADICRDVVAQCGVLVAQRDLEHDLCDELPDEFMAFTEADDRASAIEQFSQRKASNMFAFVREHADPLAALRDSWLAQPLHDLVALVDKST